MAKILRNLSSEAIENCVVCLNYEVDEVIFFGFKSIIDEEIINISKFLLNKCQTKSRFIEIDNKTIEELENLIDNEILNEDFICFDMTGNEGTLQVAMSNVASKKSIPLVFYDVWNDKNLEIGKNSKLLNVHLRKRKIDIDIKDYIQMIGGNIKEEIEYRDSENGLLKELMNLKKEYNDIWNYFVACLQLCDKDYDNKKHYYTKNIKTLLKNGYDQITENEIIDILNLLSNKGIILNFKNINGGMSFDFANESIMYDTIKAGNILENIVFEKEKKNACDCRIDTKLVWEGMKDTKDDDVFNEVDVLRLDKYVLTFISCKDTKELHNLTLYELETVARRFGGKYAKMKLVTTASPTEVYINRAKYIGIKIECIKI